MEIESYPECDEDDSSSVLETPLYDVVSEAGK